MIFFLSISSVMATHFIPWLCAVTGIATKTRRLSVYKMSTNDLLIHTFEIYIEIGDTNIVSITLQTLKLHHNYTNTVQISKN